MGFAYARSILQIIKWFYLISLWGGKNYRRMPVSNFHRPPQTNDKILNKPESSNMREIIFLIEESPEGGFNARAVGVSIFTEAENRAELHEQIRDAVMCHFEEGKAPQTIRLQLLR